MPKYILNENEQSTWEHEIHNVENCSEWHLPNIKNRIDLWSFNNCEEAIDYVKLKAPTLKVDGCYWCTSCHTI